ncbi:MAG: hypothetical protein RLZ35_607 [Pseudomonadota bacterium]|jgi:TPR repeat protein
MSLKSVLKNVFSIPMLLVYILVYVFRLPIMIFILTGYTHYIDPHSPFSERIIGEFYFSESRHADALATLHFNKSLSLYTQKLADTTNPNTKGRIEALIGSQYECGKGVAIDIAKAKQWYSSAATHGNTDAKQALHNLEMRKSKGDNIGGQCVAPLNPPNTLSLESSETKTTEAKPHKKNH